MTSSMQQLREMIPLYLNGSLSDTQVKAFEQGLATYSELQQELDEFSAIHASFNDIKIPDDAQFAGLFKQIERNINQQSSTQQSFSQPAQNWLSQIKDLFLNPYVSWGVALAQFAIVAVIVFHSPANDDTDIRYQSLSQHTAQQGIIINVVFKDSVTLSQLNTLLLENQLKIIATPGHGKAFELALYESADVDSVIKKLRQSDIVRFAEKQ